MQVFGVQPDEFTIVALLSVFSSLNESRIGKQIHGFVYRNLCCVDSNVSLKTAILDMYAKCGLMDLAERVFSSMASSRSTAAWSSMVSGYARSGEIEAARRIFDKLDQRDVICWTAMISGYSQSGQYSEALELLAQMGGLGIRPDEVTMAAVLSSCARLGALLLVRDFIVGTLRDSKGFKDRLTFQFYDLWSSSACTCHSGLIEEGKELFRLMSNVYGIKQHMEHYGCIVDLLGRDGCLDEAYGLIQSMPFEANSIIWRALLGACKLHGNAKMGEVASQKLIELEPDHGARYVLLSNMLANTNQWEQAGRVRKVMEDRGIQKPPLGAILS
ncbi:hypothetical protein REPUB_Repub02eG0236700 [Reevesia pubescens]